MIVQKLSIFMRFFNEVFFIQDCLIEINVS